MRALLVVPVFFLGNEAWSDSYDELAESLAKKVTSLERSVSELGNEGEDASDVRSVIRSLDEIIDVLGDMEDYEGSVDGVDRLISGYERDLAGLSDALGALADMKERAGEIEPMIRECADIDRAFLRYMNNEADKLVPELRASNLDDDAVDPELLEAAQLIVTEKAIEMADEAKARLDLGQDIKSELDRFARTATNPRMSHSDLREAKSILEDAASETHVTEQGYLAELSDACTPVIEYEDHRAYQTVMLRFSTQAEDLEQLADDFVRDAEAWLAKNERIGDEICQNLETLREAYCDYDAEPNETNRLYSRYDAVADDVADTFRQRISEATNEYDRKLAGLGSALADYDRRTQDVYDRLRDRMAIYYRLDNSEMLRGSNNPKVKLWRDYGVQQHGLLQQQSFCHLVERAIPGFNGALRVDCVDIESCEVVEFKPDSSSGSRSGARVDDYVQALNAWLESEWDEFKNEPVENLRASSASEFNDTFVRQAIAHECLVDGEGQFEGIVETYSRCVRTIPLDCVP